MSLLEALRPRPRDVIPLLTAQFAVEAADLAFARQKCDALALAVADGKGDAVEADKAHAALAAAGQRHKRTARTLEAAQTRAAEQARAAAREAQDAELSHCVALAEQRAKAADATEAGIKHLAELIDKQRQAEIELDRALPANFGTAKRDGLYLEADELRASVHHEFDRLQIFGGPPPWHEHRAYAIKFHESVEVMRRRRAALLGLPE